MEGKHKKSRGEELADHFAWYHGLEKKVKISISDIPEDKFFDDYPDDTEFILEEKFPRYILDPYERIYPDDPRYEKALTREEIEKIITSQQVN